MRLSLVVIFIYLEIYHSTWCHWNMMTLTRWGSGADYPFSYRTSCPIEHSERMWIIATPCTALNGCYSWPLLPLSSLHEWLHGFVLYPGNHVARTSVLCVVFIWGQTCPSIAILSQLWRLLESLVWFFLHGTGFGVPHIVVCYPFCSQVWSHHNYGCSCLWSRITICSSGTQWCAS